MFKVDQKRGARLCGLILGIAVLLGAGPVSAQLTVTPITWDVVGLDHNRPLTSGPELFPVGAEVCSAVATTNVDVGFVWLDGDGNGWDFGTGHSYINLRPSSLTSLSFASIGAGECVDAYFELKLNRSAAAFGQSREYVIQADDGVESASSPSPRAIHVEYLVSQNRNTTSQIRYGQQQDQSDWVILGDGGGINLAIDQTYFIELTTQTSTAYEELQSFVTLSNTIFQVVSVSTTYSNLTAPPSRVPVPNPRLWADGCLWDSDLDSPNYLSCLADGKAGGVVVTTYEIRIISSGGDSVGLEALIYDRSGGSYHYNTDYSESPGSVNTYDPTDSDMSKRFVPDTIGIGGTSRLRFTISNPNPIEVTGYNFIDNLPAGLEVASTPNASTTCGGIWNPLAADTVLAFDGGTIVANGTCTILVDVTAAAAGSYDNTSNNLFIGTTDTGNNANATLVVSATPPPVLECDDLATLALWQFPAGASATAPAPTSSLVTVSAAAGAGLTPTIETDTNDVGTGSWSSDFISQGALALANDQYFEFVIDTTGLDTVTLDFAARRTAQGAQSIQLYYGPTTGTETAGVTYSLTASNTWMAFGPTAISTGLNPAGDTRFRLYVFNSGQSNNGHAVFIDGVSFRGLHCGPVPPPPPVPGVNPPEISKSFSPNPIGVGQQSTLTFVVTNPNPATALTGIAVSDQLPSSLAVVSGSFGGTCTGFWDLDPSDSSVLLHSAGTLAGGASCTLTVDLVVSSVGSALNISDAVYATESGYNFDLGTGIAQATLDVLAPPIIDKDFDPNLVLLGVIPGDASVLTFTIGNPNAGNAISGVSFTDTFPAGLVVATPPNASTSGCGVPVFAPAGGDGALLFSGGSIAAGGSCVIAVDVTGPIGVYPNTSSPVSHIVGGLPETNGQTASDTVQIDAPIPGLAFVKQVGPSSDPNGAWSNYLAVTTGNPVYYKITVENTGEVPLTGITVTDPTIDTTGCTWPVTLPVADAAAPTAHIAECIVGPVTAIAGTNTNTAIVTTTEVPGPTTDTASYATAELDLVKTASPLTYTSAGEIIIYSFTVTNTGAAILAGPVVIIDPLVLGASCPSLTTIGNNDNFFDSLEAIVCTGTYTTQASDVTNLSITNTAQANAGGFDSPTDSATVTVPVAEPTIGKVFGTDPNAVGGTSALTITVTNNALIALTGVGFSDTLPAGLTFAAAVSGNTCGGTATVNVGFDTLTLAGGGTAASSNCAVTIDVNGDVAGSYTNTTSVVSSNEVVGTTTGSDTLDVTITGPTIAKGFVDSLIGVGETTSLTITVTNTAATALSNVAFSDSLPVGLLYAGAPSANTCGGTATVNAGNDTLTLAGGAIAASGSCSVTVDVTGVTAGNYTNTTSVVTSDEVNGTTTGSDTLQVEELPTITKVFTDDSLAPGDTTTLTITVTNNATIALTNASFVDQLPVTVAGELEFVAPVGGTCGGTPVISTGVGTNDTLTVTGIGLAAASSCTVTVDVQANAEGGYTNTTSVVSSTELTGTSTGSDDLDVGDLPTIAKGFAPDPINAGATSVLTITTTNNAPFALTGVDFSDTLPAGLLYSGAPISDSCGGTTTVNGGADTLAVTGGSIAADSSCTITIAVLGAAGGTHSNTTSVVDSAELTGTTTGSDTLTVIVPEPTIGKAFGTDPIAVGGTSALTITVTNNSLIALTGVSFSDVLPAGLSYAGAPSGNTCGGTATVNAGFDTLTLAGGGIAASSSCAVTIDVNGDVAGSYTNTTSVVSSNEVTGTTTGSDTLDVTTASLTAPKTDVLFVDNDGDGVADPGDTIRYTIVVANGGGVDGTNVAFADTPDANTSLMVGSVTTSQGVVTTGNTAGDTTVGVDIGTLAAAGSVTITFDVTVNSPFPTGITSVANQGVVTAGGGISVLTDDPDTGAADDPTVTPVEDPSIDATKADVLAIDADGNGFPSPGDTLEYTIEISNTGNMDLTGVSFSDTPGANTALVVGSVTSTQGAILIGNTAGDTSVNVDVGTVAVSATVTVTFRVTIDNPLPVGVTSIANQGTVTTNETPDEPTDDPDTVPDDDPTDTPVTAAPVLEALKSDALLIDADGNTVPSPGDTLRYTVTISNTGNTDATSVAFTDPIPANTTVVAGSVTTTQGTVTSEDPVGVIIGDIPASGSVTITFDVLVDNPLPGGVTNVANQGTASAGNHPDEPTDDPDTPADDDPTITPLTAEPVIEASKTDTLLVDADGSGDVSPGDTLSYSVTIGNTGNTDATGVVFTDTIPANTTVVAGSVATSQGTVDSEDPVQVAVGAIAASATVNISFQVVIDSPLPAGVTTISNQGVVTSIEVPDEPTDDPDTVPDDDPTNTPVNSAPDLSIVKDDGGISTVPGGLISYTLSYANNGNQAATGVVLTETVPASTIFNAGASTPGWVCVPDGNAGSNCTLGIGALAAGVSGSAIFAVTVDNPVPVGFTQVSNSASIADDGTNGPDPTPGDNTDNDTTPVIAAPDLAITKDDGGITAVPGDTIAYTLSYGNNGNQGATGVALTDVVPVGTTFNAGASTPGWVCVPDGNAGSSCTLGIGALAAGASGSAIFAVTVDNPVPVGFTQVSNSASIADDGANGPDPTPGDNTDSDTTPIDANTDVTATKADALLVDNDGDGVADPGDTIRYTVVVSNAGTVAATNVDFADTPDANTALVVGSVTTTQGAVTSGNTAGDTAAGVDIGTLAVSDTVTITFDVTVNSPFPAGTSSVANQGLVTGDGGISVPTDDPDTGVADDPTVTPVEDPSIDATKADVLAIDADGNGFPSPGDTLEYTVEISNTGNMDLTGVSFSDTPDANTALVVGSVTTTLGTVTTGNTAGDTSVSVDVGTVAVAATATITFRVTIDNPLPVGVTQVSNQGTVTTNETPDEPTDDPDTVPDDDPTNTSVTAAPVIDALKSDALHIDADGSGGPSPGDTLRYTVTISNTGNTDATAVVFTDSIPTFTTAVAGSVTTTQGTVDNEDPVQVTVGTIAASATVTITFDVLIDDPLPGGVTQIANQGTVSSSNHGDVPTDDPDTPAVDDPTLTPVTAEPIIEASKTDILLVDADGSGDVSPGDTLSYTAAISNTGNTDATGVVFTDAIPTNTSVVAGSVSTSQGTVDSEDPVQVTVGTIAPAATVNISFNVVIDSPLPAGVTEISNQGTVSSNEVPDEPTDDPGTVPDDDPTNTTVNGTPDLSIVKDDGGISTVPGGLIAYTLSYANNGNQAATGVVLTETVPASTIFNAGASTAGWVCVPDGNAGSICTLAIGALAAGGSGNAIFAVTVNNPVPVGFTQVVNTASVADDGANGVDPTPGNNTANDTTPVSAAADVSATKADALLIDNDGDGVADPGDTLRYTVVVSNTGTTAATSVVFTDTPDANTALVVGSVTTSQGSVTIGNTPGDVAVEVNIGTLAAAGSVTTTFDVTVDSPFPTGFSSVANQGTVIADGGISVPTDDPDTGVTGDPTVTPVEDPGVEVTKVDVLAIDADGNGFPSPGDTLEYTVEISNTGNIDLTGVTFSDTPGANTALVVGSVTISQGIVTTGNTAGDTSVSVDVGTVAVAATASITFRVTIDNPLPVGVTQVSNQGTVTTNETPDEPTNDPDTVPDDDPTNTSVTAAPVIDAMKSDALHIDADGNGIPSPGDTIRYTVTINNTGNTEATSVFFIDPIPTYTTVVVGSVTSTQGTVNSEEPVDVSIGDIAAGATVTIIFDVLIDNPLPGGVTELSNQGTVLAGNHGDVPTDDPDTPAVDDPTLTPLIAAPVIEASKVDTLLIDADGSGDVSPGDTLSYSVAIDNMGNTDATGVVFSDPIPANTLVVAGSVTTSQGSVDSEDPVQVTVGTIVAGGSVSISFNVLIDNPLPAGVTEISNQGTVSSNEVPDEPTNDPDTVPDDDPTNTPVNSAPDLSIVKDDGGISTVPGGLIVYTLSYANNGNQSATGVTLTETVPANTSFSAGASTAGWVCVPDGSAGSLCTLAVGNLAAGGAGSATFGVVVLNPVPVGFSLVVNNASIADDGTNGADPTPGNNATSDTTPVVVSSSPSLDALKEVELLTDPNGNSLADPGELLRYTVTVINDGDTVIENVVLRDTPDVITTLVVGSVTTSLGTITVGNGAGDTSVEVVFGDLAVGQTVVVVFDVMINNPVPPGRTHVSNQGVVSSDTIPDEPTNDPDTSPDDDPTLIRLGDPITGIPDLGGLGRLLFMLTLAMAGAALIRRRLI